MCPKCKESAKMKKSITMPTVYCSGEDCKNKKNKLGHGIFETSCSCSLWYNYEKEEKEVKMENENQKKSKKKREKSQPPKAIGDNLHADELEDNLKDNKGKCRFCKEAHPGFCSICNKLMTLGLNGEHLPKVFVNCCKKYYHYNCW